jgi:hypothetical protein
MQWRVRALCEPPTEAGRLVAAAEVAAAAEAGRLVATEAPAEVVAPAAETQAEAGTRSRALMTTAECGLHKAPLVVPGSVRRSLSNLGKWGSKKGGGWWYGEYGEWL